jgi:hypothetical protein
MKAAVAVLWLLTAAPAMFAQSASSVGVPQIVYDNTSNGVAPAGDYIETVAYGDDIQLAGTSRRLTKLEFLVNAISENPTVPAQIELVIWRALPGQIVPGTVIWRSGFQNFTFPTGATVPLVFNLPKVLVPTRIVWTLQLKGFTSYLEAPRLFAAGPATVGKDDVPYPGYWIFNPLANFWIYQNIGNSSWYCRITAERGDLPIGGGD